MHFNNKKIIQGQQCECPQLQNKNSLSRLKTMNYFEIHNIIIIIKICASPTTTIIRKKIFF